MSVLNPVLYGRRLYSRTIYAWNPDPQTFNLTFNESVGSTDSLSNTLDKVMTDIVTLTDSILKQSNKTFVDTVTIADVLAKSLSHTLTDSVTVTDSTLTKSATKRFNEAITLTDSLITNFVKRLNDTVTLSDSIQHLIIRTLSEVLFVQDSPIIVSLTVALQETLLLQDWISIRLMQPNIWSVTRPVIQSSSYYGRILYARNLYSGTGGIVWQAPKPTVPSNVPGKTGWRSYNQLQEPN